jgi:hypothetical protein
LDEKNTPLILETVLILKEYFFGLLIKRVETCFTKAYNIYSNNQVHTVINVSLSLSPVGQGGVFVIHRFLEICKKYKVYIIILIICLILETFLFNIYALKTYNNKSKIFTTEDFIIEGFKKTKNNTYILKNSVGSIELLGINEKINSIYFNFDSDKEIKFKLYYTDENSSTYTMNKSMSNNNVVIYTEYEKSKYIPCDYIGKTEKIKLEIDINEYKQYSSIINDYVGTLECSINSIEINKPIPFNFNVSRILLLFITASFIYALINEDFFNKVFCNSQSQKNTILYITLFFIAIEIIVTGGMIYRNSSDVYSKEYVDALLKGQAYLLDEPSQELKDLTDPYDYGVRKQISNFKWDTVLYNGKYYVYFGILPALVFFVPIRILGFNLSTSVLTAILTILSIIVTTKFFIVIIQKWYKNIAFKYVVLLLLFFLFNNRILWVISRPQFYEMIVMSAYFFVMLGMYMIIKSDLLIDYKNVNWKFLFFGCLFLALAVSCRPLALIVSILILPDLIKLLKYSIKEFKQNKKIITNFILFVFLPYVTIGLLLAIYNYVRFDNIFEFGDSYQLTVTNIKNMKNSFTRILLGLRKFLFDMPIITDQFPFILSNTYRPEYQGIYYIDKTGGGIFTIGILPFVIFLLPFIQKDMRKEYNKIRLFIYNMLLIAMFMILTFLSKYGVSGRYMLDICWLFNLSSVLIILFIYSKIKDNEYSKKIFFLTLVLIVFISCALNMFGAITGTNNLLRNTNLCKWYMLKDIFTFLQ